MNAKKKFNSELVMHQFDLFNAVAYPLKGGIV
jgi:hypothetical protein